MEIYTVKQITEADFGCEESGHTEPTAELKEAEAARWLSRDELDSVKWLPADQILVDRIKNMEVQ